MIPIILQSNPHDGRTIPLIPPGRRWRHFGPFGLPPVRERKTALVTERQNGALIPIPSTTDEGQMALEAHIKELTDKHQKLQELIEAEMTHSGWDEIRVASLKKEKLRLKDEIERLRTTEH